jgi:hypothetical protein
MTETKEQRKIFDCKQAAFATRMTLGSFYVKVNRLGIKGKRTGRTVTYTRKQVLDIFNGVSHK